MAQVIRTAEELPDWLTNLKGNLIGVDTEFERDGSLVCIGISVPGLFKCLVVVNHRGVKWNSDLRHAVYQVMANNRLVIHNAAADLAIFKRENPSFSHDEYHCTLVQSWLLDENTDHKLNSLAVEYLGRTKTSDTVPLLNGRRVSMETLMEKYSWQEVPQEYLAEYCPNDADLHVELHKALYPTLAADDELATVYDLELKVTKVVYEMQARGVRVDLELLDDLKADFEVELNELEDEIRKEVGDPEFNPRSNDQLGHYLFDTLGLPLMGKTKGGKAKVDKKILERLDEAGLGFAGKVLTLRAGAKKHQTYINPLMERSIESRIHGTFRQTGARTGRFSSKEPNLQNIPSGSFREVFTAEEGYLLAAFDYSQIELRIIAADSQDKNMLDAFRSGADFHSRTAEMVWGTSEGGKRKQAKAINFGLAYGITPDGLGAQLRTSKMKARQMIDKYQSVFWGVDKWSRQIVEGAYADRYVKTKLGRKRRFTVMGRAARRQAVNARVQGTAADLMKLALVAVREALLPYDAHMVLTVHDEIVVELRKELEPVVVPLVTTVMENVMDIGLETPIDCAIGPNWYENPEKEEEMQEEVA